MHAILGSILLICVTCSKYFRMFAGRLHPAEMRKLIALSFLPHEQILSAYEALQEKVQQSTREMKDLTSYIGSSCIRSTVWPPEAGVCLAKLCERTMMWRGAIGG